ncbi:uncharacterized protein DUF1080 [Algoriphagus ratkowskyi]|uniref:DUF1080 domain-containing protein n=1 Tax=Algoriphagus ratkowskyi TaxID=57028 RepID=A0A2W7QSY9_9BACT|nr:DUF1080 domain-containing protein [Algoriphagus ratkowskyi]PZX51111.1 uncharacterized protein DUF1080 [Algoriphagus ratkowskyi]TXD75898.1 DUF1080 domain-containing protein [Algoriphagus ratkowskyi]
MRKISLLLVFVLVTFFTQSQTINLFDGKSLDGWYMDVPDLEADSSLRIPFIIRDGLLVSLGTPQGHLITETEYDNYTLELDYRFAGKPGNCGILVHASTPRALYDMFPKSIEVQLMHSNAGDFWCIEQNIEVEDMVARRGPKEEWGVNGKKKRRIMNLTDDSEKPLGEWNHIKIVCNADKVTVWLNGDLVNDGFNATATRGKIALQAEGAEVEFKNVTLTEL